MNTASILIIDDTPTNLSVVVDLLEGRGYRVVIAQDGEEGLQRAQLVQPSLILLDVMLPGADGFEICRRLKADKKTCATPVIFMTALTTTEHKVKGFAAGGVDYVPKPLQIDELMARVDTHLKLFAAQRQLEKYSEELEQRVAERTAELAERERQFRSLAENAPDNIARYDLQGRHVYINQRLAETLGLDARDVLGKTHRELNPDWNSDVVLKVIKTGETTEEEVVAPATGAGVRYHSVLYVPERGENGEIVSVLAIGRDITERKLAEQRLWMLDFALNQVREGAYLTEAESSRFMYVNDGVCRALGYSREELLAMTVFDIDPDATPEGLAQFAKELPDGPNVFERRHKTKDGRIFPVEISGRLFDYQGRRMSISLAYDITGRKRMEAAHRAHLHFFESMDRVNRAIQQASDPEQMMSDVLDIVRAIFDCDRVFLLYPCDPDAPAWWVPKESDRPEYPGVMAQELVIPMDKGIAAKMRLLLDAGVPLKFGPGGQYPIPAEVSEQFGFKSLMSMALRPRLGKPWEFGIHQCSCARVWTADEERLLQKIGWRLADGLTSLLAYRQLRDREAELCSLADSSPYYILRYDRDGRMTYANVPMLGYFGLPLAELVGKRPCEVWPDGRYAKIDRGIERVLETETEVIVEFSETPSGGGTIYHQVWIVPERGVSDEVVGIIAFGLDISERKRLEERLALVDFALNHAMEGAFLLDERARFHYVNKEVCSSLGYSREELLSMDLFDIDPDLPRDLWPTIWSGANEKGSGMVESRHRTRDGRIFPIEVLASNFEYGGKTYSLAMTRDITERKENERKLAEIYTLAKELASRREEALETERKRIARDMHDELGQYLTALRMGISVLRMRFSEDKPEILEQVQNVMSLLDRTIQVVRDMATRLRPAPLEMGVVSALEWLVEDFSKRTGIHCELDAGSEEIDMSDNQTTAIFRIVQESLTNVSRYAGAGHVDIHLGIVGENYMLRVRDDGKGFDPAAPRKKSFGLVGIRERTEMLGGEVNISSAPGQGATIEVHIPKRKRISICDKPDVHIAESE